MYPTRRDGAGVRGRGLSKHHFLTFRLLLILGVIGCFVFHAPPVTLTIKAPAFAQLATTCQSFPDLVKHGDRAPLISDAAATCHH
jgi:hypothetical protein